jgi:hypothetical protein
MGVGVERDFRSNKGNLVISPMKKAGSKVIGEFYVAHSPTFLISEGGQAATYITRNVEEDGHCLGTPENLDIFLNNPKRNTHPFSASSVNGINA